MGAESDFSARMRALTGHTGKILSESVQVVLIIAGKFWEFLQTNPNLAIGVAMGMALGALVGLVPLLGPLLSPILTPLFILVGAVAGYRVDRSEQGELPAEGITGLLGDGLVILKEIFQLFAGIFQALRGHFAAKPPMTASYQRLTPAEEAAASASPVPPRLTSTTGTSPPAE
jgi:hypothetical protein